MDTGEGRFASLHPDKARELESKGLKVFRVGELTHLKGSKFKVVEIQDNKLVLELQSFTLADEANVF